MNPELVSRRSVLRGLGIPVLAIAALPLAGCGGKKDKVKSVTMGDDLRFEPAVLTISVGTSVRWQNKSAVVHTVTCDPSKPHNPDLVELPGGAEPWDSGLIEPTITWERLFDVPGVYRYLCVPHEMANMTGTVVVEA
jgi:plastocyanin